MPLQVPWVRLIRFVADEDGNSYYGEPIVPNDEFDIGRPENGPPLKAKLIEGHYLSPSCIVTDKVLTVRQLLGPLTIESVPAVRCIGGNYKTHLNELGVAPARNPIMFPKFPTSITGYGDNIEIPKIAQDDQADYEGELVVVIGKDAKNVAEEDAWEYIVGYAAGNDVSARKWQMDPELVGTHPPPQMSFSKAFDTFCPIGPCIVAAHHLLEPQTLRLRTYVNGHLRQDSNTSQLLFKIPRIIQFCSQGTTLAAGSVILTGTPEGVGYAMKPPQWLRPGDRVEVEIEKIGTLVNQVIFA